MKILILGKGGREHAFAENFAASEIVDEIYISPGNPGMTTTVKIKLFSDDSIDKIIHLCRSQNIYNVFIGSESYLENSYADQLRQEGFLVIGPNKKGARLESSKAFCKDYLIRSDIPTARSETYSNIEDLKTSLTNRIKDLPLVLKWDYLASGKGVFICHKQKDLENAYNMFNKLGGEFKVIVEDYLEGEEISAFSYVKNNKIYYFGSACDYKKRTSDKLSPNTGGMGAFSPNNKLNEDKIKKITLDYSRRLLDNLKQDKIDFEGFLFWGIMLYQNTPYVLEINTRFGDPEAQAILPRIANDMAEFFFTDNKIAPVFLKQHCLHIVKVDPAYPKGSSLDEKITIKPKDDIKIYFAGVYKKEGNLYTRGGRILGISCRANSLGEARNNLYSQLDVASFKQEAYREDIGC